MLERIGHFAHESSGIHRMHIAIIGTGISGMVAAALLHPQHQITVYEANNYIGGHTHTVDVELRGIPYAIDTGFIVCNDWTYPAFLGLMRELGVPLQPTEMGFSVRCDQTGIEYNGSSLSGLFTQRSNLLSPRFYRFVADVLRFNREAPGHLAETSEETTVGDYLRTHHYSRQFMDWYLIPMGAAIWSCPTGTFEQFPMRFIIEFYKNHGLLQIFNRPQWRVVQGGSREYVKKLTAPYLDRIQLNCPVQKVTRTDDGVAVRHAQGTNIFDEVIFACHSDQALRMLADATTVEREVLTEFPYSKNVALLHTDTRVLPSKPRAWASWNYHVRADRPEQSTLTYHMNILQGIKSPAQFLVTLNEEDAIDPACVLGRYLYDHPIFTTRRAAAQRRHGELIRQQRTSYCGAYWGNGFHEDGVVSALAVCERFGVVPSWSPRSAKVGEFAHA